MVPSLPKDYERTKLHYHRIFECLDVNKIVFVGPMDLETIVKKDISEGIFGNHTIEFLCESDLVSFNAVKEAFSKQLTPTSTVSIGSAGWYYQQFLKMKFSDFCEDEYYLCWDADTIPLRHIDMFSPEGKPYLDVKTELQERYFITVQRLFGFGKVIEKSFVSEHMLFNKNYMTELIEEIERTSFEGDAFFEKILFAASSDNISLGFSEFETYGTWIGIRHPAAYSLRNWKSFRNTNFFVDINDLTLEDIEWLSKDFDAASFEKYQETNDILSQLFHDPRYREKLSPQQFYQAVLESGAMGDYEDGVIKSGEFNSPV
jgi:hypothetical protein